MEGSKKRSVAALIKRRGFRQFLNLCLKYKYWYLLVILFQLGGTGASLMLAETSRRLFDGGTNLSRHELYTLVAGIFGFVALGLVCTLFARICNQIINTNVVFSMRQIVLTKLIDLSLSEHENRHSSRSKNLLFNELEVFKQFIVFDMLKLLALPISFIAVGIYLLNVNPLLGVVAILVGPLQLISNFAVKESFKNLVAKQQEYGGEVFFHLGETLSGMREIKMNQLESTVIHRFQEICQRGIRLWVAIEKMEATRELLRILPEKLGYMFGIGVGAILMVNGQIGPGALVAFITLLDRATEPFSSITAIVNSLQRVSAGTESLLDTMEMDSEDKGGDRILLPEPPAIEFEHVSFAYPEGLPVLKDISFRIEAGQSMALVGPSGGGKSTIIKLLYRVYTPQTGTIRINGVPIENYSLESLRGCLAAVTQDIYLFDGTIRENIAIGRQQASDSEIRFAAELSQSLEFIQDLPEQFDTRVGERGIRLSQGQKQRIGIGRAILRHASILILDEPTSALDVETETLFQERLADWSGASTKIIIAHRLTTIRHVDVVVFLEKGHIKEVGSPGSLIREGGRFMDYWHRQQVTEFAD
ncbi:ABC transporter ATP-binding protein [Paenibacillus nasutitermitis]|uniref:Multidrug resistance ABC transporter ATP-binding/permease protein BmrA n=1 Tax=Paenibacillus nasutitermitis TaxID=1652958 RepID=A0A916YTB9_9BACL|nr:ABC transporter ATP-binding protein [Paenibacillus nasutitermitis]GGD60311.1 multidrug resistance ABC transporter ATP-binding/permease protein BmrA [Paenibacillus nasutitermitis]